MCTLVYSVLIRTRSSNASGKVNPGASSTQAGLCVVRIPLGVTYARDDGKTGAGLEKEIFEACQQRLGQGHTRAIVNEISLTVPVRFDTISEQKRDETKPTRHRAVL
jgi:hypothetical protein